MGSGSSLRSVRNDGGTGAPGASPGSGRAPESDAEALAERRWLADELGMPAECRHPACRRAGRCRGPRGTTSAFPGKVMPACLAAGFEELYRPVAEWRDLMALIARGGALAAEIEGRVR